MREISSLLALLLVLGTLGGCSLVDSSESDEALLLATDQFTYAQGDTVYVTVQNRL